MISYIHLIRHGITTGNKNKELYGASDLPLSEEGRAELERLAATDFYPRNDMADYYTTGMLRAEQSFRIIYGKREHRIIELLKEMDFGKLENMPLEDISKDPLYRNWMKNKALSVPAPGGESFVEFGARINKGFDEVMRYHQLSELSKRHNGQAINSIIICHAGTITTIMCRLFPDEAGENFFAFVPDPGHGYTIEFADGKATQHKYF